VHPRFVSAICSSRFFLLFLLLYSLYSCSRSSFFPRRHSRSHTYPACTSCTDLVATTQWAVPRTAMHQQDLERQKSIGESRGFSFDRFDESLGLLQERESCPGGLLSSLIPPLNLGRVEGRAADDAKELCGELVFSWWEKNILVLQGSTMPMYWYIRKERYNTNARSCYLARTDLIEARDDGLRPALACIHREREGSIDGRGDSVYVVTAKHSESPSFTCYDHDRCREECRDALGGGLNLDQTNELLRRWVRAVVRERNGGPNRGLNEDTVLQNYVEPRADLYENDPGGGFPRSTHMMYARPLGNAANVEAPGTYWTRARVNTTMYEALSRLGLIEAAKGGGAGGGGLLVAESAAEATTSCPDGTWCNDRDAQGKLSIRRFCAQPFICPVRTHHTRYHIPPRPKSQGGARRGVGVGVMAAAVVVMSYLSGGLAED
jgi:hypothetical protein